MKKKNKNPKIVLEKLLKEFKKAHKEIRIARIEEVGEGFIKILLVDKDVYIPYMLSNVSILNISKVTFIDYLWKEFLSFKNNIKQK